MVFLAGCQIFTLNEFFIKLLFYYVSLSVSVGTSSKPLESFYIFIFYLVSGVKLPYATMYFFNLNKTLSKEFLVQACVCKSEIFLFLVGVTWSCIGKMGFTYRKGTGGRSLISTEQCGRYFHLSCSEKSRSVRGFEHNHNVKKQFLPLLKDPRATHGSPQRLEVHTPPESAPLQQSANFSLITCLLIPGPSEPDILQKLNYFPPCSDGKTGFGKVRKEMSQNQYPGCLAPGPVLFPLQVQGLLENVQLPEEVRLDEATPPKSSQHLQLTAPQVDMSLLPQVSSVHFCSLVFLQAPL